MNKPPKTPIPFDFWNYNINPITGYAIPIVVRSCPYVKIELHGEYSNI